MTWVDLAIVLVLLLSTIAGLLRGFFRTACALIGFVLGLMLAAWHYGQVAPALTPILRSEALADAVAFLLIAVFVAFVSNLIGVILSRTFDKLGLGCIDRIGGALFGFMQGSALVILGIVATVAFFPHAQWLQTSRLPKHFVAACRMTIHMSPDDLAGKVRTGLQELEKNLPRQLYTGN